MGDPEKFTVSHIVKQETMHGPIICCAETAQLNNKSDEYEYHYGKVVIEIPVFMDDVMTMGDEEHVTKTILNCRRMEIILNSLMDLRKQIHSTPN